MYPTIQSLNRLLEIEVLFMWNSGIPVSQPRNKKLLVAPGIATRGKDATTGSWPYY